MGATDTLAEQSYTFKASPWSSHSQILALIPQNGAGKALLDVGCWDGAMASRFADRGFQVTGVERQSWPPGHFPANVKLVVADLHHGMPELSERFDYILCADVIEHLLENAKVLVQLRSLLKPGGQVIVSVPNSGNLYFRAVVLSGRFPQDEKGLFDRTHIHFRVWSGWRELFLQSGYNVASVLLTPVPFSVFLNSQNGVARGLEWFFWKLACLWKTLFAYQFIVILERSHD
jgi:SAM-dependent methyltransferase